MVERRQRHFPVTNHHQRRRVMAASAVRHEIAPSDAQRKGSLARIDLSLQYLFAHPGKWRLRCVVREDDAAFTVHQVDGCGRQFVHFIPEVLEQTEIDGGYPVVLTAIDFVRGDGCPEAEVHRLQRASDFVEIAQGESRAELHFRDARPCGIQRQPRATQGDADHTRRAADHYRAIGVHQRQTANDRRLHNKR